MYYSYSTGMDDIINYSYSVWEHLGLHFTYWYCVLHVNMN